MNNRTGVAGARAYLLAGLGVLLALCVICGGGSLLLSGNALLKRAQPAPTAIPAPSLRADQPVVAGQPAVVRGEGFAPGEVIQLFAASSRAARVEELIPIGEGVVDADGRFAIRTAPLGLNFTNVFFVAKGDTTGYTTMPEEAGPIQLASPTVRPNPPTQSPTLTSVANSAPTSDPNSTGIWRGQYFANRELQNPPAFGRVDGPSLNFDWSKTPPGAELAKNNFSVIWNRNEFFSQSENYIFSLSLVDGARVYLDDQMIINEWHVGIPRVINNISVFIPAGLHRLKVEYFSASQNPMIQLSWSWGYSAWRGTYYRTTDLTGQPAFRRDDSEINFNWGFASPGPGVNPGAFSVDWMRNEVFTATGTYIFTADVDDGVRVFVDGKPVDGLDNFASAGSTILTGKIDIPAGQRLMQVQYANRGGLGRIRLTWALAPPPNTATPTPTRTPAPTPTLWPTYTLAPTFTPGAPTLIPPTYTPAPPTLIPPTVTPAPFTPTQTRTPTKTPTPTRTFTPTSTPTISSTQTITATATIGAPTLIPSLRAP